MELYSFAEIPELPPALPELPVLGSGKLDLAKLAEMAQNFCTTGDPLTPPETTEDDARD